ncbi:MAG: sulfur reduction protein DsrS [Gammaproteobacteria bacterium (ex Lamellibrachia satsuma)]|nr:MAG: sulfur reduction protein DsrS [Gammaproteobacteria bacterium (ex Lamellibrachia satsuma)]RRS34719.1 MAG: sulfur reduction protein DsrS [Gammaproteobacteria bacterium (ex Lamellibrachia satsuma)]RRS35244.1 MAG: sulfur reduction protein DsrS [Gammaproteobacteria bacterium (ex Lamellibrachia satsuma)]
MDLSNEDALRLNVLLATKPRAIRINESSMTLYGLSDKGEARIQLNPNCRDDQYLVRVRELLSGHATGSPGGYPLFLKRWTRMGQTRCENLEQLLLLGEPEAVVAVTCADGLTDDLARLAWWSSQEPENARRMLANPAVVAGEMGAELAEFLVEYLPFETEPEMMVESLKLVLQPGLVSNEVRQKLWKRCSRKSVYYLGFLASIPDRLPEQVQPRGDRDSHAGSLVTLAEVGNPYAEIVLKILSAPGQSFIDTVGRVMVKPANQEVVTLLLDVLRDYFTPLRPEGNPDLTLEALEEEAEQLLAGKAGSHAFQSCLDAVPELAGELKAMRIFSGMGYGVVRPVFSHSDAIGTLMRRKLEPVFTPLMAYLRVLKGDGNLK